MTTPKWQPGESGNPNGRPKDKTPATLLRKSIANDIPEIVNTLIEQAKKGDIQAAKILLDRICPPLKPQSMNIRLTTKESLTSQSEEIVKATLEGDVSPDIAAMLVGMLANQAKIKEIDELTKRIEILEGKEL